MVEVAIEKVLMVNSNNAGEIQRLKNSLLHLLISHHGIMEWGSPVEPLTIEACVLHHADNLDAQVQKFLTIIRGENLNSEWAAYDPGLGKSIFLGRLKAANLGNKIAEEA